MLNFNKFIELLERTTIELPLTLEMVFADFMRALADKDGIEAPFWKFIHMRGDDIKSFPYVDLSFGDKPGFISFTPPNSKEGLRKNVKCGKIFKLVLPELPDSTIEKMIYEYTSEIMDMNKINTFEIVTGDTIYKYYDRTSYYIDKGELSESCMTDKEGILEIYTENPNVCSLLVLKHDEETIYGRALLWTLATGEKFMDRAYTIETKYDYCFIKYAENNNFLYKRNPKGNHIVDKKGKDYPEIEVNVKDMKYKQYPYLDTLFYYLRGKLSNDKFDSDCYLLRNTDGETEGGPIEDRINVLVEYGEEEILRMYGAYPFISSIDEGVFSKDHKDEATQNYKDNFTDYITLDYVRFYFENNNIKFDKDNLNDDNYDDVVNTMNLKDDIIENYYESTYGSSDIYDILQDEGLLNRYNEISENDELLKRLSKFYDFREVCRRIVN